MSSQRMEEPLAPETVEVRVTTVTNSDEYISYEHSLCLELPVDTYNKAKRIVDLSPDYEDIEHYIYSLSVGANSEGIQYYIDHITEDYNYITNPEEDNIESIPNSDEEDKMNAIIMAIELIEGVEDIIGQYIGYDELIEAIETVLRRNRTLLRNELTAIMEDLLNSKFREDEEEEI